MVHYLFIVLIHFFYFNISAAEHTIVTFSNDTECLVCLDTLVDENNPRVSNPALITICCKQFICSQCVYDIKKRAADKKTTCPNCQKSPLNAYIGRYTATTKNEDGTDNAAIVLTKTKEHCSFLGKCFH